MTPVTSAEVLVASLAHLHLPEALRHEPLVAAIGASGLRILLDTKLRGVDKLGRVHARGGCRRVVGVELDRRTLNRVGEHCLIHDARWVVRHLVLLRVLLEVVLLGAHEPSMHLVGELFVCNVPEEPQVAKLPAFFLPLLAPIPLVDARSLLARHPVAYIFKLSGQPLLEPLGCR